MVNAYIVQSEGNSHLCFISHRFARYMQKQLQNFELGNEVDGQCAEERDLRHSTDYVRFHVGDFQNVSYLRTLF